MTVADHGTAEVVLAGERVDVDTEWVASGGVRVRKRIVTTTQWVEVTVRREELEVDQQDAVVTSADGRTWAGTAYDGPVVPAPIAYPPRVFLLSEEVPLVGVSTRVYERATVHSVLVSQDVTVSDLARREQAVIETSDGVTPPSG